MNTPDPGVRSKALLRLAGLAVEIAAVPRLGYEIARVLQLTNPPRRWVQDVTPVVEALVLAASNETERQRWIDVGAAIVSRQP